MIELKSIIVSSIFIALPMLAINNVITEKKALSVIVGSQNKVKVNAVEQTMKEMMPNAPVALTSVETDSKVRAQPLSLNETIAGAINRAKTSFNECDLSFGIESGLIEVPQTKTGFMNICVCALFDGKEIFIGLSPAFECPASVIELITSHNLELSEAFKKAGITSESKLGTGQGAIGILSDGKMDRLDFTKSAIFMALIAHNSASKK